MGVNMINPAAYFGNFCQSPRRAARRLYRVALHYADRVETVDNVVSVDGGRAALVFWTAAGPPIAKPLAGLVCAEVL